MSALLNASELSVKLGVACATITSWAKSGVIPADIHEGRLYRFDLEKVKSALAARAQKGARQ